MGSHGAQAGPASVMELKLTGFLALLPLPSTSWITSMRHCTEPVICFLKIHFGVPVFDSELQEKENLAHAVHKNSLKNYHKPGAAGSWECTGKVTGPRNTIQKRRQACK